MRKGNTCLCEYLQIGEYMIETVSKDSGETLLSTTDLDYAKNEFVRLTEGVGAALRAS